MRRMLQLAGLLTEEKKKELDDAGIDMPDDAEPKGDMADDKEEAPAAVVAASKKLCKDLCTTDDKKGMFADEEALTDYLMKLYDAGMKAGT